METAEQVSVDQRITQAEADIKALAESVEKLLGVCAQLKAAQAETLAVMRQLLSRNSQ